MTHYTTLNRIRSHDPCVSGWSILLRGLGKTEADDEPLAYSQIVAINGIDDALDVSERYAVGMATDEELTAAGETAKAAQTDHFLQIVS